MAERVEFTQRMVGRDRELTVPIDELRASRFTPALLISGATLSNNRDVLSGGGRMFTAGSPVRIRPVNLEIFNNEAGWIEVEFRDGVWTADRVLGPFTVAGRARLSQGYDDLRGRYFTSSIFAVVLSGWIGQPLSNDGVKVTVGYVLEPTDLYL